MTYDFIWLSLSIVAAGYLIGDGLKNFGNPNAKSLLDILDEGEEVELIAAKELHVFLNVPKEATSNFVFEHPEVPYIELNGHIFFQKQRISEWLEQQ
ncbi:DNA-binding protein [Viridibacillus sp. YIM B01967]|uniref:DNA-binding protein n=1 Tax=Viridibacillus soli TaxID=2798301 RepID=A0ABS1H4B8_9BACL|nr:DNA-binding protein [Viridibacillus soli]MBK3494220.1 DNA-binding protein [Viridibacillus soli]